MDGSAAVAAGGDGDPCLGPSFADFDLVPRMGIRWGWGEVCGLCDMWRSNFLYEIEYVSFLVFFVGAKRHVFG